MRLPRLLAAALLVAAVFTATALAATKNGITPSSPKAGGKVALGKSASFKFKSTAGSGSYWVHVCKSKKKDSKGVICRKQFIGEAKKRGSTYKSTQKFFDFPAFWLNNAGTYYWQAHKIDCSGGTSDCLIEGPIVKFRVG